MKTITLCLLLAGCALHVVGCDAPQPGALLQNGEIDLSENTGLSIWSVEVDGRVDRGYFYPDENVVYWAASLPGLAGQAAHYELRGEFPHARFMSIQGYTGAGAALDGLIDYQIEPSGGSVNPFQGGAGPAEPEAYTVAIIPSVRPESPAAGALYLPDAAGDGKFTLVYRVYWKTLGADAPVPEGYSRRQWEKQGQKPLPRIYYVVDDAAKPHYQTAAQLLADRGGIAPARVVGMVLNALGHLLSPLIAAIEQGPPRLANDPPDWFVGGDFLKGFAPLFERFPAIRDFLNSRDSARGNVFPNNATVYYAAFLNLRYGDIAVTRFRAPTFPDVDAGEAIDPAQQQVRYWSVCMHDPFLMYTTACKKDADFAIGDDGFVTIAFSRADKRPLDPETGEPFRNWLPVSSPNCLVFYRHMLPATWFTQSAYHYKQSVTDSALLNDYGAVAEWSGDYGPKSVYCSKEQFQADACAGQ